jgi:hypothetical protein
MFLLGACIQSKAEWLPSVPAEKHIDSLFESLKSLSVGVLATFFKKLVKTYQDIDQSTGALEAAFALPLKQSRLDGMK